MMVVIYIVSAVVLLGLCIFIHEMGHLLGGMMVGIKARVFSLGYGKGIIKKEWKGTTWQITAIPLGGYCAFYGDDPTEERDGKSYEFLTAAPWRRMVAVIMGPLFNLIFGIILFFIMNLVGFQAGTNKVIIPSTMKSGQMVSPAFAGGIRSGDKIVEIDGEKISSFSNIKSEVVFSEGKEISITVERAQSLKTFKVKPQKFGAKGHYSIGVIPYGEDVMVSHVVEGGVAEGAALKRMDKIIALDGLKIKSSEEFIRYIQKNPGKEIKLSVLRGSSDNLEIILTPATKEEIVLNNFENKELSTKFAQLKFNDVNTIKTAIDKGELKLNGIKVSSFKKFKNVLIILDGKDVKIETAGGSFTGRMKYRKYGFVGLVPVVAPEMIPIQYGPGKAFVKAIVDPFKFIGMNLKGLGMIIAGKLSVKDNLSGPIRIAKLAGDTAYYGGLSAFVLLMAQISIILMVMNLLPIPAVDGSYLIIYTYETIVRRPINQKVMERIQMAGFLILITLGVYVIGLDIFNIFIK